MTELDLAISAAFASEGKQEDVNKVYLALLRTPVFVPVEKMAVVEAGGDAETEAGEPFKPLFAKVDEKYFMLIFDSLERLEVWAGEDFATIGYVQISGLDVVRGINEDVFLCLNVGTEFYKEFSPEEVMRLKMVAARIEQLRGEA